MSMYPVGLVRIVLLWVWMLWRAESGAPDDIFDSETCALFQNCMVRDMKILEKLLPEFDLIMVFSIGTRGGMVFLSGNLLRSLKFPKQYVVSTPNLTDISGFQDLALDVDSERQLYRGRIENTQRAASYMEKARK